MTLFGEQEVEWGALIPIGGFITVGRSWVKGDVAGEEGQTEAQANMPNETKET